MRLRDFATQVRFQPKGRTATCTCNVCGARSYLPLEQLKREWPSCESCNSNPCFRGAVHLLSSATFGESLPSRGLPLRRGLRGLGLSDPGGYADELARKLDKTNAFLRQGAPPRHFLHR